MLRDNTPPPGVVLLELQPRAVRQNGYEGGALALLQKMQSWGYTDVSHSGCVRCPQCGPYRPFCPMPSQALMRCSRLHMIPLGQPASYTFRQARGFTWFKTEH